MGWFDIANPSGGTGPGSTFLPSNATLRELLPKLHECGRAYNTSAGAGVVDLNILKKGVVDL